MDRTVDQCRALLADVSGPELANAIDELAADPRVGVRRLVEAGRRRRDREECERARLLALLTLESSLREQGYSYVAGLDEVGRGALAGPVTVAAVVLPPDTVIDGLNDSKLLDPAVRSRIAMRVEEVAITYRVVHVAAHVIDVVGIAGAIRRGMERALHELTPRADHAVTDGHPFGLSVPETSVIKGDSKVAAIAAASVIAKVARDEVMVRLGSAYPAWGFEMNKGYGTAEHIAAVMNCGVTPVHRRSFAPCDCQDTLF